VEILEEMEVRVEVDLQGVVTLVGATREVAAVAAE
jgi:hypothetical protein